MSYEEQDEVFNKVADLIDVLALLNLLHNGSIVQELLDRYHKADYPDWMIVKKKKATIKSVVGKLFDGVTGYK